MNIDSIKNYPASVRAKAKHKPDKSGVFAYHRENYAGECVNKNEKLNRGYQSDSQTSIKNGAVTFGSAEKPFEKLGRTFYDKICRSKSFQWGNSLFEENSVIGQALVALIVAGGLRPATNLSMAGKEDKEDSIYAASHAMSSALIGFIVSSIIMAPFGSAFRKIKNSPQNYLQGLEKLLGVEEIGKRKIEKSIAYKKISKIAQFIPDTVVLGIPKAMLTIALIPPILKYVFHMEKGSKKEQSVPEQATQNSNYLKEQTSGFAAKYLKGSVK